MGGFQIPNIEFADVANRMTITNWESGMSLFGYQGLVYWPTPLEFGVALGVVALGGFLAATGAQGAGGSEVPPAPSHGEDRLAALSPRVETSLRRAAGPRLRLFSPWKG